MATLSDVAALAGVSISAVSRVLSNAPSARVSVDTRSRIEEAARTLGYRPNFAARALRFSRSNVVALIVPDLTNAVFSELMRGVEDEATERGYLVLLARAERLQSGDDVLRRLVGEGRVDGVLVQVGDSMSDDDLRPLLDGDAPAVFVNSRREGHVGSVVLPDAAAARLAVEHLVELGHTEIGFINGVPRADTAGRREEGFRAEMERAGLDVRPEWIAALGYEPAQGRAALRRMAENGRMPGAIVVANVNAALGVLLEARVMGIRVPEELSIVAIHDAWPAENTWPPLTCVRMPLYALGRLSMTAMYERLTGGVIDDASVTEPPVLVRRESTVAAKS
jgi:LacI family transcriptional regulator